MKFYQITPIKNQRLDIKGHLKDPQVWINEFEVFEFWTSDEKEKFCQIISSLQSQSLNETVSQLTFVSESIYCGTIYKIYSFFNKYVLNISEIYIIPS